jgi:hypothetical protein
MNFPIRIDSAARDNPLVTSPSQCRIRSSNHIFRGRYGLKLAYIPVTYYSVTATNQMIYFTDSTPCAATLAAGFYDSSTILVALTTAMNAVSTSATYTVTKSTITRNILVTASTGTFAFNFGNTLNSGAALIGFPPVDTARASSQLAPSICNLAQIRSFNININNIPGMMDLSSRGNYTFMIPVSVNQLSILVYEPYTFFQSITFDTPTRDLTITIYDDNHNIITLQDDFFIILQQEN